MSKIFAGVRSVADAEKLEALATAVHSLMIDVTDADSISKAVETVTQKLGDRGFIRLGQQRRNHCRRAGRNVVG